MKIIGSINGNFDKYLSLINGGEDSIQLGNFGSKITHDKYFDFPVDSTSHRILFGSNDFYPYLDYPHSMGDYGLEMMDGKIVLYIRGGSRGNANTRPIEANLWYTSSDKFYWEDQDDLVFFEQELSNNTLSSIYTNLRVDIIISHEAPQSVYEMLTGDSEKTKTRVFLEKLYQNNQQPDKWLFANYKNAIPTKELFSDGTLFIPVGECESINI